MSVVMRKAAGNRRQAAARMSLNRAKKKTRPKARYFSKRGSLCRMIVQFCGFFCIEIDDALAVLAALERVLSLQDDISLRL